MVRRACRAAGFLLILLSVGSCMPGEADPAAETGRRLQTELRGGGACGATANTFVRAVRGASCDTYGAEVAGWSQGCVSTCDAQARLREATASAAATCAQFCADRNCPTGRYDPPKQCATIACDASPSCPGACPMLNQCTLEQLNQRWNCKCIEL